MIDADKDRAVAPSGLIHIYCGDGKGKTTAAVGLAVRMTGMGKRAVFVQFYKDGSSSEIKALEKLGIRTMNCKTVSGWFSQMGEAERRQAKEDYSRFLDMALAAAECADLLVLDELIFACNNGTIDEARVLQFLRSKPEKLEVVLTGRDPSERLLELADYITEMKKRRHPFDKGTAARQGVEF